MLDNPIIVSDEEVKNGDKSLRTFINDSIKFYGNKNYKIEKIIAGTEGLPSINWNGLEEEFGWTDIERLTKEWYDSEKFQSSHIADYKSFYQGFKKAQELNEKKFSLEEVETIVRYYSKILLDAIKIEDDLSPHTLPLPKEYIQSLQPKVFDIEIEMEMRGDGCEAYKCNHPLDPVEYTCDNAACESDCYKLKFQPEIINNQIKIIKKL